METIPALKRIPADSRPSPPDSGAYPSLPTLVPISISQSRGNDGYSSVSPESKGPTFARARSELESTTTSST